MEEKSNSRSVLENKLKNLEIPDEVTNCRDVKCQNEEHILAIDSYVDKFFDTIEETAKETLPIQGRSSNFRENHNITGWND